MGDRRIVDRGAVERAVGNDAALLLRVFLCPPHDGRIEIASWRVPADWLGWTVQRVVRAAAPLHLLGLLTIEGTSGPKTIYIRCRIAPLRVLTDGDAVEYLIVEPDAPILEASRGSGT